MVAWRMVLCTPEYPNGRELILISNDLTIYIGSFGPKEDILFHKASVLARERKCPRVCVECTKVVAHSILHIFVFRFSSHVIVALALAWPKT